MGGGVVVALGGNAILRPLDRGTDAEQYANVYGTCGHVAGMIAAGHDVVITHGNGPQVGNLLIQNEEGIREGVPLMPLDVCVAMTQGHIGYMIQRAMTDHLSRLGIDRVVVSVVTQSLVNPGDQAFLHPAKPIGPFYTADRARRLRDEKGYELAEVRPDIWRRVVASPEPIAIVEREAVLSLIASGAVVIAAGGGGIPVVRQGDRLVGVEAVIDKDLASLRLALDIGADVFIILTDVQRVELDYGTPGARPIDHMTAQQARRWLDSGQFPPGSMGPKVEAAIRFASSGPNRQAIITSLDLVTEALAGGAGTRVTDEEV